jgi:hypothetical protein
MPSVRIPGKLNAERHQCHRQASQSRPLKRNLGQQVPQPRRLNAPATHEEPERHGRSAVTSRRPFPFARQLDRQKPGP